MSEIVNLIERIGREPALRYASSSELESRLESLECAPHVRDALLRTDRAGLEALLGATANVCCVVHAPDEDDDDEEEAPQRDDDERKQQR